MIPLSALPIKFAGNKLIPIFLDDSYKTLVESLISFLESLVGKNTSEDAIEGYIESTVGNYRLAKSLYYVLRYFYEIRTKTPFDEKGRKLREDKWRYLKIFYKWVGTKYGYIPLEKREKIIREFCREMNIDYEFFNKLLESENPFNTVLIRKHQKPYPELVLGIFNFLVIEKLLSISERAKIYIQSENIGRLAKILILRAKYHEVIADFKKVGSKLVCDIVGPHQIFKLPSVSDYGRHIAWILSPVISYAKKWFLSLKVIYRKRKFDCFISSTDVKYLTPYWEINPNDAPKESYDSSVEARIHSTLKMLLERKGIKVLREADVILLNDGTIMIPDFVIVKDNKKLFLEVIGYWRKEYIKKKKDKIRKIITHGLNVVLLIDQRHKKEFDELAVDKVYYHNDYIPFGKLCKTILKKLEA